MQHQDLKRMLILSLYGELNQGERFLLDEHLQSCARCRQESADLEQFHAYLGGDEAPAPPEELLFAARHSLFRTLDASAAPSPGPGLAGRFANWLRPFSWPGGRPAGVWLSPALSGAAMLAVGLLCGYWMFSSGAAGGGEFESLDAPGIANLRFLDSDPDSREVELVFDEVRPVRLKGSIDDQAVRRILTHAAVHDRNPGIRLRAVLQLGESLEAFPGDQIKQTLVVSLQTDRNDGVRKRALEALQRLPFDADVQQAFLYVLQYDPNPGLRVAVINALERAALDGISVAPDLLEALKERMTADDNDYVRIRSQSFLRQVEYK
ncbi:MAG: HEAT repeat domain-containing protein [Acidobacteriota bacterium]